MVLFKFLLSLNVVQSNSLLFAHTVNGILIFFQGFVEVFCRLKKCNFIIFLINHRSKSFVFVIICANLVLLDLQLMSVFQGPFVWILEIDCNRYRKLSIARIMYFKWMLLNSDEWFWKALMDLKLDFLYEKWEILFLHEICGSTGIFKSSYVGHPFMWERPVLTWHIYLLF